ncbi:MAG: hypothetical protein IJN43_05775 [Ruminococcus sp.]|nr:hypothetical protein [Ruminococcus sp.]
MHSKFGEIRKYTVLSLLAIHTKIKRIRFPQKPFFRPIGHTHPLFIPAAVSSRNGYSSS